MKANGYLQYVLEEIFRNISGITSRAMFGGYGLYRDGKIFGMIADDILYFKVGDSNRADYESLGSKPFTYSNKGKTYTMSYWQVPDKILDDSEEIKLWVNRSLEVKKKESS